MRIDIKGQIGRAIAEPDCRPRFTLADLKTALAGKTDDSPIELYIDSPGGDCDEGKAIYNLLKSRPEKVIAHVVGDCDSMASIILCAADESDITGDGSILWHRPSAVLDGVDTLRENELTDFAEVLRGIEEYMTAIYAENTGLPADEVERLMYGGDGEGTQFSPREAVRLGLVDKCLTAAAFKPKKRRQVAYALTGGKLSMIAYKKEGDENVKKNQPKQPGKPGAKSFKDANGQTKYYGMGKRATAKRAKGKAKGDGETTEIIDEDELAAELIEELEAELDVEGNSENETDGGETNKSADGNADGDGDEDETNRGADGDGDGKNDGAEGLDELETLETLKELEKIEKLEELEGLDDPDEFHEHHAGTVCPNCETEIIFNPADARQETDPNGTQCYSLTCTQCGAGVLEPISGGAAGNDPRDAIMYNRGLAAGIKRERARQVRLDAIALAYPQMRKTVAKARKSGVSAAVVQDKIITALAKRNLNNKAKNKRKTAANADSWDAFPCNALANIGGGGNSNVNMNMLKGVMDAYGKATV